jgi:hypothetical protein
MGKSPKLKYLKYIPIEEVEGDRLEVPDLAS